MKKQIYKIGQEVKIIKNDCAHQFKVGENVIITKIRYGGAYLRAKNNKTWWALCPNDIAPISPKKVTKPSTKKVKPQKEVYDHFALNYASNGYTIVAWNGPKSTQLVFNTKHRLLKWIENNI